MADQDFLDLMNWTKEVLYLRMEIYKAEKQFKQIQLELTQIRSRAFPPFFNLETVSSHKIYHVNIQHVMQGEDLRTTLMIKNIPNSYTSEMLLDEISKHMRRGTYDFIYLPLDLKNKCNLGYAFINMIRSIHVVQLYKAMNGKTWGKFHKGKVAAISYARIQGKDALIQCFKNSNLKNQESCFHPILFTYIGNQEPFPFGPN